MTKYILRILSVFCLLNLIPLLWYDKVSFNIETFTTEYYKFLYNIFVVGLLALFFKNQTENIEKKYENSQNQENYNKEKMLFKQAIKEKNLSELKRSWIFLYQNKAIEKANIDFEKLNRYIDNMTQYNIEEKVTTSEFIALTNQIV